MQQLYYGGAIITMEAETAVCDALLVENGTIRYVGAEQEARTLADAQVQLIDLHGSCLLPSFLDAHSHLVLTGQFSAMADLSGCRNFEQVQAVLGAWIEQKQLKAADMVMGVGYDPENLAEKAHPDKTVLDRVSEDIPIYISHISGHMGVANTAALAAAGIDADTPDPPGGHFGRWANGQLNGYVEEVSAVTKLMLALTPRLHLDLAQLTCEAQALYLRRGITTCQDGAAGPDNLKLLAQLAEENRLQLDVVAYVAASIDPQETMHAYKAYDGVYQNRLKVGGFKMILDGSPQAKTAWLTQPYAGTQESGAPALSDADVTDICKLAIDSGHQLLTHCNGDAAGDQLLRCYQAALERSSNPGKRALRPVMIHCQTVRKDQLETMQALGMIPSIFVAHTYYWGDVHLKNLGEARGNRISPAHTAFALGLPVTFHQDTPVLPPDMMKTIWCAVNRVTSSGRPIGRDEAVTVFEALQAVTSNGAYSYFEEQEKGLLKPGYRADLVQLSANPLQTPPQLLDTIQVLATIKDGVCVYRKE